MKWYESNYEPEEGDEFIYLGDYEKEYDLHPGDLLYFLKPWRDSYELAHKGEDLTFQPMEILPANNSELWNNHTAAIILEKGVEI